MKIAIYKSLETYPENNIKTKYKIFETTTYLIRFSSISSHWHFILKQ